MIKQQQILVWLLLLLVRSAIAGLPKIDKINIFDRNGKSIGELGNTLNLNSLGSLFTFQVDITGDTLPDTKVEFYVGSSYVNDGSNAPVVSSSPFLLRQNEGNSKYDLTSYLYAAGIRKSITVRLVKGNNDDTSKGVLSSTVYDVKTYIFDVTGNENVISDLSTKLYLVQGGVDKADAFKVPVTNGGVVNLRPYHVEPPYQLSLLSSFNKNPGAGYIVNTIFEDTKQQDLMIQREALYNDIVQGYDRVLDFLSSPGVKVVTIEVTRPDGFIVFSEYFIFEILNSWMSNPTSLLQPSYTFPAVASSTATTQQASTPVVPSLPVEASSTAAAQQASTPAVLSLPVEASPTATAQQASTPVAARNDKLIVPIDTSIVNVDSIIPQAAGFAPSKLSASGDKVVTKLTASDFKKMDVPEQVSRTDSKDTTPSATTGTNTGTGSFTPSTMTAANTATGATTPSTTASTTASTPTTAGSSTSPVTPSSTNTTTTTKKKGLWNTIRNKFQKKPIKPTKKGQKPIKATTSGGTKKVKKPLKPKKPLPPRASATAVANNPVKPATRKYLRAK